MAITPEEAPSGQETDAPMPIQAPAAEADVSSSSSLASLPPDPPLEEMPVAETQPAPPPPAVAEPQPVREVVPAMAEPQPVREVVPMKPAEKPRRVERPRRAITPPINKAPASPATNDVPPSSSEATSTVAGAGTDERKAPPSGLAVAESSPDPAYLGKLRAYLERHKIYPRDAKKRRIEGSAMLRFTIDAEGKVLRHAIERSTGSSVLDEAVERMVTDASPLPRLPPEIVRTELTLVVPISFTLE